MKTLYFITGSQDLYGEETLAQAAADSKEMAAYLSEKLRDIAEVTFQPVVRNSSEALAVSMIDMGDRFRLVCAEITLVKQPEPMPKLPVARVMWRLKPDFATGSAAWIYAGGTHHAVVSTALTADDIRLFAKMTDAELVIINDKTELNAFEQQLELLDTMAKLRR